MTSSTEKPAPAGVAQLQAMVGLEGPAFEGPDPVNAAMIRHWCAAIGDRNPAYTQPALAAQTPWGGVIAPPAMLQAWVMPGFGVAPADQDPIAQFHQRSAQLGYSSIVATNCEQEYLRPLRLGDRVSVRKRIEAVSDEKRTALGAGLFLTTRFTFTDGDGHEVAHMLHRVLKFKPGQVSAPAPDAAQALRPRPNLTHDNAGRVLPVSRPCADLPVVMRGDERAIGFAAADAQGLPRTLTPGEVHVGARLARLEIPITRSYIVASAIATRDYQDVHHDPDLARARGSQDVFLNILTTTGLVGRLATDAFGPAAHLRKLAIKLGATAYPGDTLTIEGQVVGKAAAPSGGCEVTVRVRGTVSRGEHVSGEVMLSLPAAHERNLTTH